MTARFKAEFILHCNVKLPSVNGNNPCPKKIPR